MSLTDGMRQNEGYKMRGGARETGLATGLGQGCTFRPGQLLGTQRESWRLFTFREQIYRCLFAKGTLLSHHEHTNNCKDTPPTWS